MSDTITPSQFLQSLSEATVDVVETVSPSVVSIGTGHGRGTGVIWNTEGNIVTCSHVIGNRSSVKVGLSDGSTVTAKVIGHDSYSDIALLKVDEKGLQPIEKGDSEVLKVGQFVLALANPFHRKPSATSGMITSVGGSLRRRGGPPLEDVVVTDARLNPGYSGGPLVDVSGRMLGMNIAVVWARGIAIPVNHIQHIVEKLASDGKVQRAYLGITSTTIPLPRELASQTEIGQESGIIVLSVEPKSPAKRAGLVLGDVIIKFDDKPVTSVHELPRLLTSDHISKKTKLTIIRGEKLKELTIKPVAKRAEM